MTTDPDRLGGELHDELVRAMQRVPELAGRPLALRPISGGITNRNFLVEAPGSPVRWVIRLAGNDTHLLGISREVEHAATVTAAGVGVGPEVTAFIRPEGYLVTRFIEGSPVPEGAVHRPETLRRVADSLRRIHDGPAIPGLFVPFQSGFDTGWGLGMALVRRIVEDYEGRIEVDSAPAQGTVITLVFPVRGRPTRATAAA